ncbi:hypothetical protein PR048_014972 [Dryococelus australis]|uniref:Uncharacterized protein n=1 Tax=Dryococelus australis TaxID=614101 RepID=A0ABQ9HFV5_9NEOP|nr:hypothetical protein PR048_014972 [Dryococelus australis]
MLGFTRRDRKRADYIRSVTKVRDILERAKTLKWQWAGHIARRSDNRWTTAVIYWIPRDLKKSRGRPPDRWGREIRVVGVNWKNIAHDLFAWKELETTYHRIGRATPPQRCIATLATRLRSRNVRPTVDEYTEEKFEWRFLWHLSSPNDWFRCETCDVELSYQVVMLPSTLRNLGSEVLRADRGKCGRCGTPARNVAFVYLELAASFRYARSGSDPPRSSPPLGRPSRCLMALPPEQPGMIDGGDAWLASQALLLSPVGEADEIGEWLGVSARIIDNANGKCLAVRHVHRRVHPLTLWSSDINPLDIFLLNFVKYVVYKTPVRHLQDLRACVTTEIAQSGLLLVFGHMDVHRVCAKSIGYVRRDFARLLHVQDPPRRTVLCWEHKLLLVGSLKTKEIQDTCAAVEASVLQSPMKTEETPVSLRDTLVNGNVSYVSTYRNLDCAAGNRTRVCLVARLPVSRLERTGFNPRPSCTRVFASGDRAGRCCWLAGIFSEIYCFPLPCIPVLLHSHLISPSSALEFSLMKATPNFSTQLNSANFGRPPVAQSVDAPPIWVAGDSGFKSLQSNVAPRALAVRSQRGQSTSSLVYAWQWRAEGVAETATEAHEGGQVAMVTAGAPLFAALNRPGRDVLCNWVYVDVAQGEGVSEVSIEQLRCEGAGKTGDHLENLADERHRPAGTMRTCEDPAVTRPGIENVSRMWEVQQPNRSAAVPRPLRPPSSTTVRSLETEKQICQEQERNRPWLGKIPSTGCVRYRKRLILS